MVDMRWACDGHALDMRSLVVGPLNRLVDFVLRRDLLYLFNERLVEPVHCIFSFEAETGGCRGTSSAWRRPPSPSSCRTSGCRFES